MKILFVKSMFCPNEIYCEVTIKSLIKINMFIGLIKHKNQQNDKNLIIDIYCIGWTHKFGEKMKHFIDTHLDKFNTIEMNFWDLNYGKYCIFNQLIEYVKSKSQNIYDLVIYMDHDVYFDMTCAHFFDVFYILQEKHTMCGKNLGLMAFNQKKDNRHKKDIYENSEKYLNYQIVYPSCIGSIASGGFMIFPNVLIQISPFSLSSIYGLDDYYLSQQLDSMNYLNIVIENVYIIHPFDSNDKYTAWKKNKILKMIKNIDDPYYQQIQDSINFWSNIR